MHADGRFEVVGRARNGREAVELARRLKPDAVVMDIEMPEVDGVEATRQLQEQRPTCRCSRSAGTTTRSACSTSATRERSDYVRKARVEDELVEALVALLRT